MWLSQPMKHEAQIPYARFSNTANLKEEAEVEAEAEGTTNEMAAGAWGELCARDVLELKRRRSGVNVAESGQLKEYLQARAKVHTVNSGVSVKAALDQLLDRKLTFLVVLGESHQVLGVVSERHFVQAYHNHTAMQVAIAHMLPA